MKKPKIYGLKKNGVYVYIGKTTKYQEDKVNTRVTDGLKYRYGKVATMFKIKLLVNGDICYI